jgi:hypothetical protein
MPNPLRTDNNIPVISLSMRQDCTDIWAETNTSNQNKT